MHDLQNNEAEKSDGVRLAPPGLESLFGVKPQQYGMHVDAIEKEIKLVLIFPNFPPTVLHFAISFRLYTQFIYSSSCQSLSKYLNLTFGNGRKVMESFKCT